LLHVVPYFPPAEAGGGIREAVAALARAQARAGCRVTICTTDVGGPAARRPPAAMADLEVHAFRNLSNALAWDDVTLPLGLRSWARRSAPAFDAVHLHGHRHLGALLVARARRPAPYVLSPHGTAARIERRVAAKRLLDRIAFDAILHGAARVLAVSGVEEAQLRELGVPADRVRRVPNALDVSRILPLPARGAFRKRHGIPADARVVLFLGRVTPNKRVDVLVRAVGGIPAAVLVVAGPDGGALAEIRRAAPALGPRRAILTGALDEAARREALADADAIALVSEHEIFGLAPMEGLIAGLVPVVSEGTGCAERIRAWDSGYVVDGADPRAVRDALARALDDPGASRRRAERGAEAARRELSPEAVAERTLAIYTEAAA
jgi:glycosyltransferase involved in cell wall biosynthesis